MPARATPISNVLEFAAASGIAGLLVCPMITSLETLRELSARYSLLIMAHPALTSVAGRAGSHGFAPAALWGSLFRLAGADISIFPHPGGRFPFSTEDGLAVAAALRASLGHIAPALPAPAGGMDLERVPELCTVYGPDSVLLVGGALLGTDPDLATATGRFAAAIRRVSDEALTAPAPRAPDNQGYHLASLPGYAWSGRDSSPYKDASDLAFQGVRRVELVGKFGEASHTDLRYFEIQPGGYSSLERHVHGHIVIGAAVKGYSCAAGHAPRSRCTTSPTSRRSNPTSCATRATPRSVSSALSIMSATAPCRSVTHHRSKPPGATSHTAAFRLWLDPRHDPVAWLRAKRVPSIKVILLLKRNFMTNPKAIFPKIMPIRALNDF